MTDRNTLNCTYRSREVTISLDHVVDEAGENGEYLLEWTDGVNEWSESYDRPEVALARFAVLLECVRTGHGFLVRTDLDPASDTREFAAHAQRFLTSQLDVPRFPFGTRVHVTGVDGTFVAEWHHEERNADGKPNGIAKVKVLEHDVPGNVGLELHVAVTSVEPA